MDGHRATLGSRTQATLSWPWLAENGGLVSGGGTAAERAGSGAWGSPISNLGGGCWLELTRDLPWLGCIE